VISATNRYAEWVCAVLEVTDHHGTAEIGRTYSERNKSLGPLTTRSTWTVREIEPGKRRVDTGSGFEPLQNLTNIFAFEPVTLDDGTEGTRMTYTVRYGLRLGPLSPLLHRLLTPGLCADMRTSMSNLADLILAEGRGPEGDQPQQVHKATGA
jgi:hypothetical protein